MKSWSFHLTLFFIFLILTLSCEIDQRKYLNSWEILGPISFDGKYAIARKGFARMDSIHFVSMLVEVGRFARSRYRIIDTLHVDYGTADFAAAFCESPYVAYTTSDSGGFHLIIYNYLESKHDTLFSKFDNDTANSSIRYISRDFQFLLKDSLLIHSDSAHMILRRIHSDSTAPVIRKFQDAISVRLSNDLREFIITFSINSMTDSSEYMVTSYNIQKGTLEPIFDMKYIGYNSPKSRCKDYPIYFNWIESGGSAQNIWKFSRDDSTLEQVTFYQRPFSVAGFDLTLDSIICLVANFDKKISRQHFYEILPIKGNQQE